MAHGGKSRCVTQKLLLATGNTGKVREYRELLQGIPFILTTPSQEGLQEEVAETGSTFAENALIKASHYARSSGILALADDSGLEVDALGGEPGVQSARYAGPEATDPERVAFLLAKLKEVPWEKRTARFRCAIALVWPTGDQETVEGSCEGYITYKPQGSNGFGYDPIFYLPELGKSFAEVDAAAKNGLSHRGRAAHRAAELLHKLSKASKLG